jgi:hypothetical protein
MYISRKKFVGIFIAFAFVFLFVPKEEMEAKGYGEYMHLFE